MVTPLVVVFAGLDESERHGGRTLDRLRPTLSYTTLWDATVLGEVARRADVSGPFYSLAFLAGLTGGVAAVLAVRRGERSLLAVLVVLPLLVAVGFGLAELFG